MQHADLVGAKVTASTQDKGHLGVGILKRFVHRVMVANPAGHGGKVLQENALNSDYDVGIEGVASVQVLADARMFRQSEKQLERLLP